MRTIETPMIPFSYGYERVQGHYITRTDSARHSNGIHCVAAISLAAQSRSLYTISVHSLSTFTLDIWLRKQQI